MQPATGPGHQMQLQGRAAPAAGLMLQYHLLLMVLVVLVLQ